MADPPGQSASNPAAQNKTASRHLCNDFNNVFTVLVGPSSPEQTFSIHQDVLCATSKYMRAACSKIWTEGKEKLVRLPEISPDVFRVYATWMYSGKVVVDACIDGVDLKITAEQLLLSKAWILGDIMDDLKFRNDVMRTYVEMTKVFNRQPAAAMFHEVWESTPPNSLLRKMLVDITIMRFCRADFAEHVESYPRDMVQAIAVAALLQVDVVAEEQPIIQLKEYLEPEASDAS